jgi:hypothetical protein
MDSKFYVERTQVSPEVNFDWDAKKFIITGRSMPENSEAFYEPILDWLRAKFRGQQVEADIELNLDYYNTGSFIRLMGLFNLLAELNNEGNRLTVKWICDAEDEDNIADGESMKEVVKVPFHIIEI